KMGASQHERIDPFREKPVHLLPHPFLSFTRAREVKPLLHELYQGGRGETYHVAARGMLDDQVSQILPFHGLPRRKHTHAFSLREGCSRFDRRDHSDKRHCEMRAELMQ